MSVAVIVRPGMMSNRDGTRVIGPQCPVLFRSPELQEVTDDGRWGRTVLVFGPKLKRGWFGLLSACCFGPQLLPDVESRAVRFSFYYVGHDRTLYCPTQQD